MFVLVSYDIPNNKRRLKISKTLLDFGERIQFSVFECNLSRQELAELEERLSEIVKKSEDSVRIYTLCESCKRKVQILGKGQLTEDPEIFIV